MKFQKKPKRIILVLLTIVLIVFPSLNNLIKNYFLQRAATQLIQEPYWLYIVIHSIVFGIISPLHFAFTPTNKKQKNQFLWVFSVIMVIATISRIVFLPSQINEIHYSIVITTLFLTEAIIRFSP